MTQPITLTVELPNAECAEQLAQFCKRSVFSNFYNMTEAHFSHSERTRLAYQMITGIESVQRAGRRRFLPTLRNF